MSGPGAVGAPAAPLVQVEEGAAGVAPVVGMLAKTVAGLQVRGVSDAGAQGAREERRCAF
jgi:hypothetical protein